MPEDAIHVLLVEDDDDNRELMGEVLEAAGFAVTSAASGAEGLAVLGRSAIEHPRLLDVPRDQHPSPAFARADGHCGQPGDALAHRGCAGASRSTQQLPPRWPQSAAAEHRHEECWSARPGRLRLAGKQSRCYSLAWWRTPGGNVAVK